MLFVFMHYCLERCRMVNHDLVGRRGLYCGACIVYARAPHRNKHNLYMITSNSAAVDVRWMLSMS